MFAQAGCRLCLCESSQVPLDPLFPSIRRMLQLLQTRRTDVPQNLESRATNGCVGHGNTFRLTSGEAIILSLLLQDKCTSDSLIIILLAKVKVIITDQRKE